MTSVTQHKEQRSPKPVRKYVSSYFLKDNFHGDIHPDILSH